MNHKAADIFGGHSADAIGGFISVTLAQTKKSAIVSHVIVLRSTV